ncbi:MAG TPA: 3-deoxy-7-phosphoheptulonate synthase [Planctomycetia bacterium]|nr:3-deoxy-7-phosphoheptulonate synthase [Planctomycetia bacterium]
MIIVLRPEATEADAKEILAEIEALGLKPLFMPGTERTVLGALGDERVLAKLRLQNHPHVESVTAILAPYKLVSREMQPQNTVVDLGGVPIGGKEFVVIAGPCAVEGREAFLKTATACVAAGAAGLRGGAYKPRTSPYSFQGLGLEGLEILRDVAGELGVPAVTEVVEVADVGAVEAHAAAFQVGARNMQNFQLLKALGQSKKPVILKRGMAAKVEDLLMAAEYVLAEGNPNVIFCERGIKTFETATRNTLDLAAIPVIKKLSHLPVVVDPSHGTGVREYVAPMAKAAAACGADGILVEVHHDPRIALSDGQQSLYPDQFATMMRELEPFVRAAGRRLAGPPARKGRP